MGKAEQDQSLSSSVGFEALEQNADNRCGCCWSAGFQKLIGIRCILVLLVSAAVFLSAIFWLPPFLQFSDQGNQDLDSQFKDHDIVASFIVLKPVSLLKDNTWQLADDIFNELEVSFTKVDILSLEPLNGSNITKVVFGVSPYDKISKLSEAAESLIRATFKSLVTHQLYLHLNTTLFGDAYFFEVLKFPGGITITPPQNAFLLQKVQILFNFTLSFSIYQLQVNFEELTSQLKAGLHLAPYEILYVSLENSKGSTVAAPTTVQSYVLLAVRTTPSMQRLKKLAQTITGPHSKNLGLNNTVFGRVKQVRLSSILQHSLHGGSGSATASSPSPSPSPSLAPVPQPRHYHHHHHHHNHHHHSVQLAPEISPAPTAVKDPPSSQKGVPAPEDGASTPGPSRGHEAKPPGCHFGHKGTGKERHLAPAVAPNVSPHHSAASPRRHADPAKPKTHVAPSPQKQVHPSKPKTHVVPSPQKQVHPSKPNSHWVPASSPLPSVVFAHVHPPSRSKPDAEHSDTTHLVAPTPTTSSAGFPTVQSAILFLLALVLYL